MTPTVTPQLVTFEKRLTYEDGTDTRYELDRGALVEVGQARGRRSNIMEFPSDQFNAEIARLGYPWVPKMGDSVAVRVHQAVRRGTSRVPDVAVLPQEQWELMADQEPVIELHEPEPPLVVEGVSPGTEIIDHSKKEAEYNVGIPCYVLLDWTNVDQNKKPVDKRVTVLTLGEGLYDEEVYCDKQVVFIPTSLT